MVCCCNTIGNVFRVVIVGGCVLALVMQFRIIYACNFFSINEGTGSIGIYYEDVDGIGCNLEEPYSAANGALIRFSRSAAVLSVLFGIVGGILVLVEWLFCEICCAGCVRSLAFVGAWGCGFAIYALYGMEECGDLKEDLDEQDNIVSGTVSDIVPGGIPTGSNCSWAQGATLNLIACIAYVGCSILLCIAPEPKPLCKD